MLDEVIKNADIKMYEEKRSIKSVGFSVIKKNNKTGLDYSSN